MTDGPEVDAAAAAAVGPVCGDAGVCGEDGVVKAGTVCMSMLGRVETGSWKRYESCQDNSAGCSLRVRKGKLCKEG